MVGLTCVGIRLGLFSWRPETERRIQKEEWGSECGSEWGSKCGSEWRIEWGLTGGRSFALDRRWAQDVVYPS